eukprot:403367942
MYEITNQFSQQITEIYPYLPSVMTELNKIEEVNFGDFDPDEKAIQISPVKSKKLELNLLRKSEENRKLKDKLKEFNELTNKMRKNYHKELTHYKESGQQFIIKRTKKTDISILDDEEEAIAINLELFDFLDGIDDEILKMINQKLEKIKNQYQEKIRDHIKYQTQLLKKIYLFNKLSPNAYSLINLSLEEIFNDLSKVETDPNKIWKYLDHAYGTDYFLAVIERVYGKRFAKDYDALYTEIDKVKQEAKFHFDRVAKQSETEIQSLRRLLDERAQELNQLKERQIIELDKAKKEAYFHAEIQFQAAEAKQFQTFDQQMGELYKKLREQEELNESFNQILMNEKLKQVYSKWFILTKVKQLGNTDEKVRSQTLERIFQFARGETSQESDKVRKIMQVDLDFLQKENTELAIDLNEVKRKLQNYTEKSSYLAQNLEDVQQEAHMYKERVEGMLEENRKLQSEAQLMNKNLDNARGLIDMLEREKHRLEVELLRYTKQAMKSNIIEAELHQKKALHQISEAGISKMKKIYDNNMKTKQTMTQLRGLDKNLIFELTEEEMKDQMMRKIPVKDIEIQTDEVKTGGNDDLNSALQSLSDHELNGDQIEVIRKLRSSGSLRKSSSQARVFEVLKIMNDSQNQRVKIIDLDKMVDKEVDCQIQTLDQEELEMLLKTQSLGSLKKLRESVSIGAQHENDLDRESENNFAETMYKTAQSALRFDQNTINIRVYCRLWDDVDCKKKRIDNFKDKLEIMRSTEWKKKLPKPVIENMQNLVRRDPVTGKTFINIVELNNMRQQSQLSYHADIDPNLEIQEVRPQSRTGTSTGMHTNMRTSIQDINMKSKRHSVNSNNRRLNMINMNKTQNPALDLEETLRNIQNQHNSIERQIRNESAFKKSRSRHFKQLSVGTQNGFQTRTDLLSVTNTTFLKNKY